MEREKRNAYLSQRNTLKNLSLDKSRGVSMTESTVRGIDFDAVKENYAAYFEVPVRWPDGTENEQYPSSVDAVLEWQYNTYFIEFKNGKFDADNIRNKAEDSLLIYQHLIDAPMNFDNCVFILVYNEDDVGDIVNHDKTHFVQVSPTRDLIHKVCIRRSGKEFIRFGLDYLKMYYGEVHTYDVEEFENFLKDANGK